MDDKNINSQDLAKEDEDIANDCEKTASNKSNSTIVKNGVLFTFYQILTLLVPLITTPYISRVLGASGIGIYSYTHSLVSFFVLFAGLGTISYGTREIARNREDKKKVSSLFWEIEILTVITSSICLLVWMFVSLAYTQYSIYLYACSFYLLATLFDISWLYAGLEKFKYTVLVNCFFKIFGIILMFIMVKTSEDVFKYVIINALVLALGNFSMWLFLPKVIVKTKIDFHSLVKHFKETFVYFIPTIAISIYTILDKTLIGLICKDDSLSGYYEQATKICNVGKAISFTGVVGVVSPRMSYLHKVEDKEGIRKLSINSLHIVLYLSIGCCVGVIGIADIFIPMFLGEGFDEVIKALYIMMPLCVIVSISTLLGGLYYIPSGRRRISSRFLIIGSMINLCLNLLLIPFFNIYGAIIATLIAEIIISFLYVHFSNGFYSIVDVILCLWKKLVASVIMFFFIMVMKRLNYNFIDEGIYNLLIENVIIILSAFMVYSFILLILKDKSIKMLFELLKRNK